MSVASITLSLPQSIATTSTPTFGGMALNGGLTGTTATFSGNVSLPSDTSSLIFPQLTTADTPTRDILVVSPAYDGFALRQVDGFNGVSNSDWFVFDKTDHNQSVPDGGIAFSNTGVGGTVYSLAINGSGNIGMGTLTPTSKLHVVGTANFTGNTTVGGAATILGNTNVGGTITSTGLVTANGGLQVATGQELRFGTLNDNSDAMFISRFNPATDQSVLRISAFQNTDDFGGPFVDEFQIGASPLDRSSFTPLFRMAGSGNVIISGNVTATAFTATSDRRLKTDITPVGDDMLGKLGNLNAYQYRFINNPSSKFHYGVMAQELQTLFPHAVSTNANGMLSVDYGALGAIAAVGVGRLNQQVNTLGQQITKIDDRVQTLESGLNAVDTRVTTLESWKTATAQRLDSMKSAIDLNYEKIAEHALQISSNTERIVSLEKASADHEQRLDKSEWLLERLNSALVKSDDDSTLTVKTPNLVATNFTAEQIKAKGVYTARLEAEMARIRDLEVNNLRANTASAKVVQAETVNTGSAQVYVSLGSPAHLFSAPADGHYTVNASAMDGSHATATVIVNAGQAKVVPIASEGIELIAVGNSVKAVAAGKSVRASWIRMG